MKLLTLILLVLCFNSLNGQVTIVRDGNINAKIIIPIKPSTAEVEAAEILKKYIKRICDKVIGIEQFDTYTSTSTISIFVGDFSNINLKPFPVDMFKQIQNDGFFISSTNKNIFITAKKDSKGVIYGVYELLEKYLNCRFYSIDCQIVPTTSNLILPLDVKNLQNPGFQIRSVNMPNVYNKEYRDWHRVTFRDSIFGKIDEYSVHTLTALVPKTLFDRHPEYFALVNGKRVNTHPCLSNKNVYNLVKLKLDTELKRQSGKKFWSVSQPDNLDYCRCNLCQSTYSKFGNTPQATISLFVNRLARDFPQVTISTLAYKYSIKPPRNIPFEKNVNIMLCDYNTNKGMPIDKDQFSPDYYEYLLQWKAITNNIYIWHYIVQFTNLMSPYPNYFLFEDNISFFNKQHVIGVYGQGSGTLPSELDELKTYLFSKLLWNPSLNSKAIADEFIKAYYGKASVYISQYLNLLEANFLKSNRKLRMMGSPLDGRNSYMSDQNLLLYEEILQKALISAKEDSSLTKKVIKVVIPVKYAILQDAREDYLAFGKGKIKDYQKNQKLKMAGALKNYNNTNERLEEFLNLCTQSKIKYLNSTRKNLQTYKSYFKQ